MNDKAAVVNMKKIFLVITVLCLSALLTACADTYQKGEADVKKSVNCATAKTHIKVLESEKAQTSDQVAAGVTSVVPIALVTGIVSGTAGTNARVATGDYNKMLDKKIAEIKQQCGIK